MKRYILLIIAIVFVIASTGVAVVAEPELAILLTPERAQKLHLDEINPSLAINSKGAILIALKNNVICLKDGRALFTSSVLPVSDMAFTSEDVLILVSGQYLGFYAKGLFYPKMTLPNSGMKFAGGEDNFYIFGGDKDEGSIYMVRPGFGHVKLCEMPQKVIAGSVSGKCLFFSVANDVYRFDAEGEINLMCRIPGPAITSLAAVSEYRFYFLAGDALYLWDKGTISFLVEGLGDVIRLRAGSLYILNSKKKSVVRWTGVDNLTQ